MKIKLAEALLRRKELGMKQQAAAQIKGQNIFETKVTRKAAHEGVDDIIAQVPKLTLSEVMAEHDWYAKCLRNVDAVIQQMNWTAEVEVPDFVMQDFTPPTK